MQFTLFEQSIIQKLSERAGDVLYFEDFASFFVAKSRLQISTYTQMAYVQLESEEYINNALSEYFQLVVFLKKLENEPNCYSIPYTALNDNVVITGKSNLKNQPQHTIPDADLLIQLFQYAGKKYILSPGIENFDTRLMSSQAIEKENTVIEDEAVNKKSSNFRLIGFLLILLLSILIGIIGYHAHLERQLLMEYQSELHQKMEEQNLMQQNLADQMLINQKSRITQREKSETKLMAVQKTLDDQSETMTSIRYWNYKQAQALDNITIALDSINNNRIVFK